MGNGRLYLFICVQAFGPGKGVFDVFEIHSHLGKRHSLATHGFADYIGHTTAYKGSGEYKLLVKFITTVKFAWAETEAARPGFALHPGHALWRSGMQSQHHAL